MSTEQLVAGIEVVVVGGIEVVVGVVVVVVDMLVHLSWDSLQVVPPGQGLPLLAQESAASLQDSVPLQNNPSLGQLTGVPVWQPLIRLQTSLPLQNCPSLQRPLSGVCRQISLASSQESMVQATMSLQSTGAPGTQV
jgi:hypothetical protein